MLNNNKTERVQDFDRTQKGWLGDGAMELQAVLHVLQQKKKVPQPGGRIYWETGSANGFKFITKGARQEQVQRLAMMIQEEVYEQRCELIPLWTGAMRAGTGGIPVKSTDEWGITAREFEELEDRFGVNCTIDGFASAANKKCERFYSKSQQPGTAGVNFFRTGTQVGRDIFLLPACENSSALHQEGLGDEEYYYGVSGTILGGRSVLALSQTGKDIQTGSAGMEDLAASKNRRGRGGVANNKGKRNTNVGRVSAYR